MLSMNLLYNNADLVWINLIPFSQDKKQSTSLFFLFLQVAENYMRLWLSDKTL